MAHRPRGAGSDMSTRAIMYSGNIMLCSDPHPSAEIWPAISVGPPLPTAVGWGTPSSSPATRRPGPRCLGGPRASARADMLLIQLRGAFG